MQFSIMIDSVQYREKPKNTATIKTRLAETCSTPQDFSPERLKSVIESGYTICPATIRPTLNNEGKISHQAAGFVQQQVLCVDIDNDHGQKDKATGKKERLPDGEYLPHDNALEMCDTYGIKPFMMYHSFSNTAEIEKYRLLVCLDTPITDNIERERIQKTFVSLFGRAADASCTNADRVFFGSTPGSVFHVDNDAITHKSVFLDLAKANEEIEKAERAEKAKVQRAMQKAGSQAAYEAAKDQRFDATPEGLLSLIPVGKPNRAEWVRITAAYKNSDGDRVTWDTWNSGYVGDNEKHDAKTWETCGKAGKNNVACGIGTLKYYAKQLNPTGYQNYIDDLNTQQRAARRGSAAADNTKTATATNRTSFQFGIEWDGDTLNEENFRRYLKQKGYVLRFNSIAHKVEYQGVTGIAPEHLGNAFPMMVYNDLHRELSRVSPKICGSYVNLIANKDEFNPALDAINAVTWDGENHLEPLYAILKIPTDDKLSRTFLRKWLMQGYCLQFNTLESPIAPEFVLVLHGAQGIGKTTLFTKLSIKPNLACVGHDLDTTDKDSVIKATSAFICELGEVKRTTKRDSDALKAFITSTYDEIRVPYAAAAERQPRRTNFCATTNDEHFLADDTGNRRWGVIPLESMTREDTQAILAMKYSEIIQIWAQVKHIVDTAIQNGSSYADCFRLTQEERKEQELRNGRFLNLVTAQMEIEDILAAVEKYPNDYEWKEETLTEWRKWYSCLDKYSVEKISRALKAAGLSPAHPAKRDGKNVRLRSLPFPKYKPGTQSIEMKTSGHALEK